MKIKEYLKRKRKIYDTDTDYVELAGHSLANFLHGFTSSAIITVIALDNLYLIPMAYYIHKRIDSVILNRTKYESKLGKNIIFPVPSTMGFFLGYLFTKFMLSILKEN
jgi:hypothetical protein